MLLLTSKWQGYGTPAFSKIWNPKIGFGGTKVLRYWRTFSDQHILNKWFCVKEWSLKKQAGAVSCKSNKGEILRENRKIKEDLVYSCWHCSSVIYENFLCIWYFLALTFDFLIFWFYISGKNGSALKKFSDLHRKKTLR